MSIPLPLLARVAEDDPIYRLTRSADVPMAGPVVRMPTRTPGPGEQYRFHFDMGKCIGCKCCVVACNEQNGNPAAINWRRVGEIEGGWYPQAHRSFVSMGCNHCVEPTCMTGCPVNAFTKDRSTGIVLHSADTCIGCQYCTWNCAYGVPQYNPERGVVGKCDLCHGRLSQGDAPACVSACPSGAIQVEIVEIAGWKAAAMAATTTPSVFGAPGLPTGDQSISTTRITMPAALAPNARAVDLVRLTLSEAHWSLIFMTTLTQLSVGTLTTVWLLQLFGAHTALRGAAATSVLVGLLALAASTLHLGRPIHAYRALRGWRRSWLSREVALFAAFAGVACIYAAALWRSMPASTAVGALMAALGLGGVTASACIYRVPSRPAWNTPFTVVHFHLTAATLGPLFVATIGAGDPRLLGVVTAVVAGAQLVTLALRFFRLSASDVIELRASGRLLATVLSSTLLTRGVLLALGAVALPLFSTRPAVLWPAFVVALAGEMVGRYLFFVSAVPRHMTAPYLGSEAA